MATSVALTPDVIQKAIDEAMVHSTFPWRRLRFEDVQGMMSSKDAVDDLSRDGFGGNDPLVYGLVSENNASRKALFYIAYSTWDGRVLYWNPIEFTTETERLQVMRSLANIAVRLECTRLVWQHFESTRSIYKALGASTLDGWLTLSMDRTAMDSFLATRPSLVTTNVWKGPLTEKVIRTAIQDMLVPINDLCKDNQLRLKLASIDHVPDIQRLVQGLAVYEKEPDAVHVTVNQFRLDGFVKPLYYCLLLQDKKTNYTCGMAFLYFGFENGRFLYLEDLFIEQEYRGRGGGKTVMLALTSFAQRLDCNSFVWQALDWNTPALNFYEKIGGKVVEGLLTSRFAGNELLKFAAMSGDQPNN